MTEMYSGLHVGQQFSSLDEFKTVIRSISVRQHWELRVSRSNKKSVVIGCRSSANCYFRVVCRANKNATYISSLQDSHNCRRNAASPGTTPARAEASHVRFLLSEIPRLFDLKSKIKGQDVVDAVKRYHGYDISMRQAQRALLKLQPRKSHNQNEEIQSPDDSISGQEIPQQHQSEPQRDGSEYSGLSENRWIPDHIQANLIDGAYIQHDEPPHNSATPLPSAHAPPVHHLEQMQNPTHMQRPSPTHLHSQVHPHERASLNPNTGHHVHPQRSGPDQLPAPPSSQPTPQRRSQGDSHQASRQAVLTNFKIEFTCTTCGALNQSFFPNQGNVTGVNYMHPHPVPNIGSISSQTGPSTQNVPGNSPDNIGDASGYEGAATANTRDLHGPWTTGNLGVSIAPPRSVPNVS